MKHLFLLLSITFALTGHITAQEESHKIQSISFWSTFKEDLTNVKDANRLAELFNFPLEGDCVANLFSPNKTDRPKGKFTKKNFLQSWQNLFSPPVIDLFAKVDIHKLVNDKEYKVEIHADNCSYSLGYGYIEAEEENITVLEIIKEENGDEFSAPAILLLAKEIDGKIKIFSILCAG